MPDGDGRKIQKHLGGIIYLPFSSGVSRIQIVYKLVMLLAGGSLRKQEAARQHFSIRPPSYAGNPRQHGIIPLSEKTIFISA